MILTKNKNVTSTVELKDKQEAENHTWITDQIRVNEFV